MHQNLNYEKFLVTRPLWASFEEGEYGIPIMWDCKLSLEKASYSDLLNFRNLSTKENTENKIVENFAFDYELEAIWKNPFLKIQKLRHCLAVLTPDFSITSSMRKAQIIENTFKNRWMGCFYQEESIEVIPTISWAEPWTFPICIQGIPKGNPFAISTIGVKDKNMFLEGYNFFYSQIQPKYILCYGKPIEGMEGNIIRYDYTDAFMPSNKSQQLKLFPVSRLELIRKEKH